MRKKRNFVAENFQKIRTLSLIKTFLGPTKKVNDIKMAAGHTPLKVEKIWFGFSYIHFLLALE